jgi:hypothetical protein
MDSQIATEFAPAPPAFNRQGGSIRPGFELTMSAPGPIYYTLDGSDPRALAGPLRAPPTVTLVPENAAKRVLVPAGAVDGAWRGGRPFDDSAWTPVAGGPGPIGYNRGSRAAGVFSLDLTAGMYGLRTSCYIRVPFSFTGNVQKLAALILRIRYNDGFIVYLNGIEVARRNFTGAPAWDSAADSTQAGAAAAEFENIEIVNVAEVLRPGDNLLALQGLNVAVTSPDLLISAELAVAESAGLDAPARVKSYTAPVRLDESTQIKARAVVGGRWSALNEAVFAVGSVAESLRISEIMYHPRETGDPNDANTEYIELMNIGLEAINLSQVRFTDGIDFTFPSYKLPGAGCCVVVKDRAAFEAKYGPGLPIAGQYTGSLNDAGERLVLQDAAGRTIHSFAYDDKWHSSTDGQGFSLTVRDPYAIDPNALGKRTAWRPSTHAGGSPGSADVP